ncbi:helix-turn-helix domain-containing protein [Chloroflexota bacterium]
MPTLKEIRESKFISQDDLSKLSGITAATISRLETGKEKPRFVTIRKLAAALEVQPGDIEFK